MLAAQRQKMVTDVAAAAAGAAIENEDYERADEILYWMRNDMDASVYYKLAREGKKKRDVREMDADVSRILSLPDVWDGQHFNQAQARAYVDEVYGKDAVRPAAGISPQDVARGFAPILGQEMVNKRDGCVEAALAGAQGLCPFYAREQEKGVLYVPTLLRDARADDSVVVREYAAGMEVPAGAAIIYSPPDAENAYHVLVSDGRGGVFGNSSSAADYMDENGNPVRGNGLVTHGESVEIDDDLVPALVICPKEAAPVSAYDPEKRDALLRLVEAHGNDLERSYQEERKGFLDRVLRAAQEAGSYGDAIAMLYAQDLDMKVRNALESTIAGYEWKRERRRQRQKQRPDRKRGARGLQQAAGALDPPVQWRGCQAGSVCCRAGCGQSHRRLRSAERGSAAGAAVALQRSGFHVKPHG